MGLGHGTSIVRNGLVLHLDAANQKSYPGSGTAWNDLSGKGNHRTLTNGPVYSSINNGNFAFDGVNDLVNSVTLANPNGQLTCEVVMNYSAKSTYHNIFDRSATNPMFWIRPSSQSSTIELNAGTLISDIGYTNKIINATAIFRSDTSPGLQLYIDGTLVKTTSSAQAAWSNPFTVTLFNRSNAETFQGTIYSLKFYDRALTAAEVKQNFEAVRGRYGI